MLTHEAVLPRWRARATACAAEAVALRIEPLADAAALEPAWRALEVEAEAPFFLTWAWIGTLLATLGGPAFLVRATLGRDTVGLGLLVPHHRREHGIVPVRLLALNATGDPARDVVTIEYNGMLARRGLEAAVTRALLAHLAGRPAVGGRGWDALEIMGAPDTVLPLLEEHPFRRRVVAETGSARVDLAAVRAGGKPYVATLGQNTRSQIRRACRLYGERGELRLDAARDVDEALGFLAAAGPLHQARWEARGKPGAFASPHYVDFHERLIRAAWGSGAVDLLRVSAGDGPVGYLYNFLHRGTVYFYLSALRYEADNRLKPGLVTHALAIQHYADRGLATYDLMAGASRYKASLGQPGPTILHLRLEPPGLKLHLLDLARRARDRARRVRPPARAAGGEPAADGGSG